MVIFVHSKNAILVLKNLIFFKFCEYVPQKQCFLHNKKHILYFVKKVEKVGKSCRFRLTNFTSPSPSKVNLATYLTSTFTLINGHSRNNNLKNRHSRCAIFRIMVRVNSIQDFGFGDFFFEILSLGQLLFGRMDFGIRTVSRFSKNYKNVYR